MADLPAAACEDCGGVIVVWFAPNELWNLVMGGPEAAGDPGGSLCPTCFVVRAERAGIQPTGWALLPEGSAPPWMPRWQINDDFYEDLFTDQQTAIANWPELYFNEWRSD